ncbi:MAG TPA: hypothetical protein VNJ01_00585 [Bacteriovoracaceae bacterium]|nr:hypothetical protein [Bacteriovoracaceae bacterium]
MKLSSLILASVLSTGCIAKKMAVSNADSLLAHQVNKKLQLKDKEFDLLKKDIAGFLNQSKPKVKNLTAIIGAIDLEMPQRLPDDYAALEGFYKEIANEFTDEVLVERIARLDGDQQKQLLETVQNENKKIMKQTPGERVEGVTKRFNMLFDEIEKPQRDILNSQQDYFMSQAKARLERRTRLQESLKNLFSEKLETADKENRLKVLMRQHQAEAIKGNKTLEILQAIVPTLTSAQKKAFKKNAKEIIGLLEHLSKTKY